VGTPNIDQRKLLLHGERYAVEVGDLVRRAVHRALGATAVVSADVEDQRIVELAKILYRLNDATNFMIRIGEISGVDFGLADEEALCVRRQAGPVRKEVGPGRKLRVVRDDTQALLIFKDLLSQNLPATVEELHRLDALDPFLRRMMRRVRAARRVVDEPRPVRRDSRLAADVGDGVIGHRGDQVPTGNAVVRMDWRRVAE